MYLVWRNALMLVEETEIYSRKRLSLILIEVSKPFAIQGLLRKLDSRRVICTRGRCSLNKDVAESMKELKEVLTSPSSIFRIFSKFRFSNWFLNCLRLNFEQSRRNPKGGLELVSGLISRKINWGHRFYKNFYLRA